MYKGSVFSVEVRNPYSYNESKSCLIFTMVCMVWELRHNELKVGATLAGIYSVPT